MFERASSLWRRLTHRPPAAALSEGAAAADDRRVWVRHAADAETRLTPAAAAAAPLAARIQDVSRGGVKLLVSQRFEPGDLLSVELPAAEGRPPAAVLACVVHARPQAADEWALGCRFSAELSDDDLAAFGGASTTRSALPDSRAWSRFPCDVTAAYYLVPDGEGALRHAQVLNVSADGVGLFVREAIPVGTLLSADLHAPGGGKVVSILACVVHVTERPDGRVLGCTFIRQLDEATLRALQ
jgi:hypothetical protein